MAAEVRAAYLRLAKKYHPDKNPGDKASEWIFREIQRAYEALRDANTAPSEEQDHPPVAQEPDARSRSDRARREEQQAEDAEKEAYEQWENQKAEDARRRWEQARAKESARGEAGTEPVCDDCESLARWWTRLPLIVQLSWAWAKWALYVGATGVIFGIFLLLALAVLLWLLHLVGLEEANLKGALAEGLVLVIFGLGIGFAIWGLDRPKVCPRCGRVSYEL